MAALSALSYKKKRPRRSPAGRERKQPCAARPPRPARCPARPSPRDAFHCVERRFGVYYTLYWCGQQPETEAATHSLSWKR